MESLPVLAEASRSYENLLLILFLAFAIAVIVWLILSGFAAGQDDLRETSPAVETKEKSTSIPVPSSDPKSADEPKTKSEAAKPSASLDEMAGFVAASEEKAASLFASELAGGTVVQDPVYGIIYQAVPEEVDDLKKIKGVAKVLEGKLNSIGVYRFKQIAVWTDAACAEFSKMLTFKKRIYTDNWLAQARALHEEKYGEKI